MKKISFFAFVLVLMISMFTLFVFAEDDIDDNNDMQSSDLTVENIETKESNKEIIENIDDSVNDNAENNIPKEKNDNTVDNANLVKGAEINNDIKGNDIKKEQEDLKAKKLNAIKSFIKAKNSRLSAATVQKVAEAALYANEKNKLDLSLILAVMWKESTFNPSVYNANCYGLMQIHKNTAKGFGYKVSDIKDPYKAAYLGALILKGHIKNYNSVLMGLTAYNQGSGNVSKGNYNTNYAKDIIKKQSIIEKYLSLI